LNTKKRDEYLELLLDPIDSSQGLDWYPIDTRRWNLFH